MINKLILRPWPLLLLLSSAAPAQDLIKYVDPLIGTAPAGTISAKRHSESGSEDKGQTFPGVGRPFGMTQWTPETRTTEIKCISPYYYNDKYITGFRGSHWMSGSCTQDYGSMTLMPFTSMRPDTVKKSPVSSFSHNNEISTPAYYRVRLNDFGVAAELTGSLRSGIMRFTFPEKDLSCIFLRINSDENKGFITVRENRIIGCNPVHRIYQGRGMSAGFSGWFAIIFDKPVSDIYTDPGSQNMVISFGNQSKITAYIGTSFTSGDAALQNLLAEIPGYSFNNLCKETEDVWNRTLGKVIVKRRNSEEDMVKFLYGTLSLLSASADSKRCRWQLPGICRGYPNS